MSDLVKVRKYVATVEETLHDVRPGAVVYFATLTPLETPSAPR